MELAKAGIFVAAILLIYPYDECFGASSSYPIERILRSIQDNYYHQHHHQRSHSNDHHQDDRHENEHYHSDRHQNDHPQDDRHENDHYHSDRHQNDHHQEDRHENEHYHSDRHQNDHHQDDRYENEHYHNDRHQNDHHHDDRHQHEHHQDDRHQHDHHQDDRHSNNHHDLRWSRPQEFEIIHANNDVSPVLVLGKPAREQDNREVNDPVLLDMEVTPVETQYEIISATDIDPEPKPQKVFISSADKKPAKGKKSPHRPRASVHENIAVNSLKYSKISKLNK